MVILPYQYGGVWVIDDSATGLQREPFVAGVPEMIDRLARDIPGAPILADMGRRGLFSLLTARVPLTVS
jgi:hypothetical protein